jgi:Thoeris protein ThsA, Macro domain
MINKLIIGIKRHPKRFLLAVFFGFTVLWTVLEPIFSIGNIKTESYIFWYLSSYTTISFIISLILIYPKRKVEFEFKNTNTKVEIKFGDLFSENGYKVIAVNDYFDSKIGKPVSSKSLHGVFIEKILGGHTEIFDNAVESQLKNKEIGETKRVDGKEKRYKIGETINIEYDKTKYFCFALSNSDNKCNANSTPSLMLDALGGLWKSIRIEGNGEDINLPLVGDGLSRIGLPQSQLLQLILISLLKSVKERDLSSTIKIILTEKVFEKIDLEIIKNNWE